MPITGLSFLLFALAAVVLYYLFPKRLRQYVLLAASILFYLTYGVRMAGYLAATILLTYLFGLCWTGLRPSGPLPRPRRSASARSAQMTGKSAAFWRCRSC